MKKYYKLFISAVVFLAIIFIVNSCSSDYKKVSGDAEGSGAFSMDINWPDEASDSGRLIPDDSQTIYVSITGEGMSSPITSSVSYQQTQLIISDIPAGYRVATIQALDSDSHVLAQRKESFIILNSQTTHTEKIPLGIAITGDTTNPEFEPTSIECDYGDSLYFQNWLEQAYTCRVTINGTPQDLSLPAASQASGLWSFSDDSVLPIENCPFEIVGKSASGGVSAIVNNYSYVRDWTGFAEPCGIAIDSSGYVYVCDRNNNRVRKYNSSGGYITDWSDFNTPVGITYGPDGYVYVADAVNDRYKKYTTGGSNTQNVSCGSVSRPHGIAVSSNGYVYVACHGSAIHGIQKYTTSGSYQSIWDSSLLFVDVAVDSQNNIYGLIDVSGQVRKYNTSGTLLTSWSAPSGSYGITIDKYDNVFVADPSTNRMYRYDSSGNYVLQWGTSGSGQGQFNYFWRACFNPSNNVLHTVERDTNRVQQFSPAQN